MARLVGINHVALEVGSVEEALDWYGRFFDVPLRGRIPGMAFVDMGDQFIAFASNEERRHFGLVVDDKEAVRAALEAAGVELTPPPNCTFADPWGNLVQVVDYRDIQFTKAPEVLRAMGLDLSKSERAHAELREKGITPRQES
jgi:lactoylglutathione lyase